MSRHIAYAEYEGQRYQPGRRAGKAAAAPFRLLRSGVWRDKRLLELGHGYLHRERPLPPHWSKRRTLRHIERCVTSHAYIIRMQEKIRRLW